MAVAGIRVFADKTREEGGRDVGWMSQKSQTFSVAKTFRVRSRNSNGCKRFSEMC